MFGKESPKQPGIIIKHKLPSNLHVYAESLRPERFIAADSTLFSNTFIEHKIKSVFECKGNVSEVM